MGRFERIAQEAGAAFKGVQKYHGNDVACFQCVGEFGVDVLARGSDAEITDALRTGMVHAEKAWRARHGND